MAVHLLAAPSGSVCLDMCAAPGMKTTQLAAYLRNEVRYYNRLLKYSFLSFKTFVTSEYRHLSTVLVNFIWKDILSFPTIYRAEGKAIWAAGPVNIFTFVCILQGKIYAVERDDRRFKTLCDFVEKTGSTCVTTLHKDSLEIKRGDHDEVEYILLDPSCSGSGNTTCSGTSMTSRKGLLYTTGKLLFYDSKSLFRTFCFGIKSA